MNVVMAGVSQSVMELLGMRCNGLHADSRWTLIFIEIDYVWLVQLAVISSYLAMPNNPKSDGSVMTVWLQVRVMRLNGAFCAVYALLCLRRGHIHVCISWFAMPVYGLRIYLCIAAHVAQWSGSLALYLPIVLTLAACRSSLGVSASCQGGCRSVAAG